MKDGAEIIQSTQDVKRIPLRYIIIVVIIDMHVQLQFLGLTFKVICLLFFFNVQSSDGAEMSLGLISP